MQQIIDNIDQRLAQLRAEQQSLSAARKSLTGSTTGVAAAKPSRRRARASAGTSAKSPAKVVPLGKLLKLLDEQPGLSNTRLAKLTGGDLGAQLQLLKEAEAEGKVRRQGERRATVWFIKAAA